MRYLVLLLVLAAGGLAGAAATAAEVTLPVSRVTVYSSGVAYLEHEGRVNGDAEVMLRFRTEGINDLLKSLLVMDLGGGTASGVTYASRESLERALKSFGVDLSGEPTLVGILQQLRGSEVVASAPEKITGKILGVQTRKKQILPANVIIEEHILDLVTPEGLKSIPLDTIRSIALVDEKLNADLNKALGLLVENRATDTRPVVIRFTGRGERPVRVGYVTEAPVWKSSYRLVMDGEKKGEALLQGWAIVENTSDADWEKVALTLASGRPISFIQDLYTPLYARRPVVQPQLPVAVGPREYAEGVAADREEAAKAERQTELRRSPKIVGGMGGGGFGGAMPGAPPPVMAPAPVTDAALRGSVQAVASGAAAGEVFLYRVKEPVTIPRRQSSMLPIVNQSIAARKVSIYNAGVLPNHPLAGVWLTNNTDLTFLAGPVTVLEGGAYGGDALLGNVTPNEKRLLSYAVDLKVAVDSSVEQTQRTMGVRIVRGVLNLTRKTQFSQTYALQNKADQDRLVVVEHPFSPDRKLVQPAEPAEKTAALYRFEVPVPAGKTVKFEVREERTDTDAIAILPATATVLETIVAGGEISAKTRAALAEAIRRKQALAVAQQEVSNLQQRITTLRREQADTRANMGALERNSQSFQRFEKKLLDSETQIEGLQKEMETKRVAADMLRVALEEYLSNLNVE